MTCLLLCVGSSSGLNYDGNSLLGVYVPSEIDTNGAYDKALALFCFTAMKHKLSCLVCIINYILMNKMLVSITLHWCDQNRSVPMRLHLDEVTSR